ncbi:MAG TPA: c-type cytochrome [Rhizomicrobium sp.]|jgi:cytochrome c2|nr:c-type cytochrome [Rhizomicrobium sp.]
MQAEQDMMRRIAVSLCAAGMVLAWGCSGADAAGNAATGSALYSRCYICHSNTKGASNRMGPNLFGVIGRKAGTYPGFDYSPAMKKAGFVWTVAKLDAYLADPQKIVPGNNMPLGGIADARQRADIAAYLATLK